MQIERYLLVLPVTFKFLPNGKIATESAFCAHLRQLRDTLVPEAHIRIIGPEMPFDQYAKTKNYLAEIDPIADRIEFIRLCSSTAGIGEFWQQWRNMLAVIQEHVGWADVVHSGPSHAVTRPFEMIALLEAMRQGKKTIAVMDIDLRREAEMAYTVGNLSYRGLLTNRWVHNPLRRLQMHVVGRYCSLVFFKGRSMVEDFGGGRDQVKNILDASHSEDNLIPEALIGAKQSRIMDRSQPLDLVYFGRLVEYKGIDRMVRAVRRAIDLGARLRFEIIGPGPEWPALQSLVTNLKLNGVVTFRGPIPFGSKLFEAIYPKHLMLAAPLTEDTPRSALDAMAAGVPILAFDLEYYRSLQDSGAVELCKWPDLDSMARKLVVLEQNRNRVADMVEPARAYAKENTQEQWLRRRAEWTRQFIGDINPEVELGMTLKKSGLAPKASEIGQRGPNLTVAVSEPASQGRGERLDGQRRDEAPAPRIQLVP